MKCVAFQIWPQEHEQYIRTFVGPRPFSGFSGLPLMRILPLCPHSGHIALGGTSSVMTLHQNKYIKEPKKVSSPVAWTKVCVNACVVMEAPREISLQLKKSTRPCTLHLQYTFHKIQKRELFVKNIFRIKIILWLKKKMMCWRK